MISGIASETSTPTTVTLRVYADVCSAVSRGRWEEGGMYVWGKKRRGWIRRKGKEYIDMCTQRKM